MRLLRVLVVLALVIGGYVTFNTTAMAAGGSTALDDGFIMGLAKCYRRYGLQHS